MRLILATVALLATTIAPLIINWSVKEKKKQEYFYLHIINNSDDYINLSGRSEDIKEFKDTYGINYFFDVTNMKPQCDSIIKMPLADYTIEWVLWENVKVAPRPNWISIHPLKEDTLTVEITPEISYSNHEIDGI
jgi:hypothetical protein